MKNLSFKSHTFVLAFVSLIVVGALTLTGCGVINADDISKEVPTYAAQTLQALSQEQTLASYETLVAQFTQAAQATATATPTATATSTATVTATPTSTTIPPSATPVPTATPTPIPCNLADFIKDVTIVDGTKIDAGAAFTKTWRLKNIGSCAWTTDYDLVFVSGNALSAPARIGLSEKVSPGETVDVSVLMKAPTADGTYTGYWMLADASGSRFGIRSSSDGSFWVKIKVDSPPKNVYDFSANYCSATWYSNVKNPLPCPGAETNDATGYVVHKSHPVREDGFTENEQGLVTSPDNNAADGKIVGIYPAFRVEKGDEFRAVIGCEYGSTGCDVYFDLRYRIGNSSLQTLASWHEVYEGKTRSVVVDLSELAGKDVEFALRVRNYGTAQGNEALWILPRIMR